LRRLEADTNLETSWAPVNELDSAFGLESSNGSVNILGDDITTVEQARSHVLSITWVTLHHLAVGLEARHGDLLDGVGLMGSLGCRDNWSVGNEREVDTWVWDQVGLEFIEINVEGTIESEGGGDGRNDCRHSLAMRENVYIGRKQTLGNQAVQVLIVGALKAKVSSADVVDSLVINHKGTVGVLESGVGGEDRVVWLNNGGSGLRGWVNTELQLDLLAEVNGQTLHEESTETRTSSTTE
jgi:hypothetical protein